MSRRALVSVLAALLLLAPSAEAQGIVGGNSPAVAIIGKVTTTGSQGSVTFSSIPGTYTELELVVYGRSAAATTNDDVLIQFNGDTGSNYAREFITTGGGSGTTLTAGPTATTSSIAAGGSIPGSTVTANYPGAATVYIPGYASTTFNKVLLNQQMFSTALTAGGIGNQAIMGVWNNTAAITSVKVFPTTGPFLDGTIVLLIGIG